MMLEGGFLLVTLFSLILFHFATGKNRRVMIVSLIWLALIGGLSQSGLFENTDSMPPRFMLVLIGNAALVIYSYRTLKANRLNEKLLLLIHGLRLPVEIGLYQLFLLGLVPQIMTFKGWNYDIVIGISALLLFAFFGLTKNRFKDSWRYVWHISGLISLLIIVITALLSAPSPFQQLAFDQPNVAVLQFPFIFLPGYIVPIVFLSHLLPIFNQRSAGDENQGHAARFNVDPLN